ncbi:hypothetical protein E2C01_002993 [Portunus trituberculatus]|uniref:Uncharacterized protein n=1 Tax=Portunus trituberculatus TaxID=210409 RepID=A0A5B7CLD4_PORTR|nr:hypothetical protein [Portunus trituberculatus]
MNCNPQNADWSLCFSSVFGSEVNAGERRGADHDLQQDLSSFLNMDSGDWGEVERNYLVSKNHTTLQDREMFLNRNGMPSLQSNMCKSTKMLAPRVLNRITFSQNSCVQNSHNEVAAKSVKFCGSSVVTSVVSDVHPDNMIAYSELDGVDPHLFDLSLSPILDIPPCEGENTISPTAQLNNNATILTEVTSCPQTANESKNIIPFSDQENSVAAEVVLETNIMKEIIADPQILQNQQNLHLGEGEINVHREEMGGEKDLVDLEENKITFVAPNVTLYSDNQRSYINEHNYKLLNGAVGKNSKLLEKNTELDHFSVNENMNMPSILTASISHVKDIDAEQVDELPTTVKHTDSDASAHPLILESMNKFNADTDGIMEHKSEHSKKNTNMNLELQKACNESVDIVLYKNTDVTVHNKTQECNIKEKLCTEIKDTTLESEDVQTINENAVIFNTSCDATHYSEFIGEEQENIIHNKVSDKSEILHKTRCARSQIIRNLEHTTIQDRFITPKKPTFRAPYKVVSESPIIGYPLDRRNITSTPKETQKKRILRFGSGYSSDSSDTSDGTRDMSDYKIKHFTTNGDMRPEQYPAVGLNLVEKKSEFKPQFISKLRCKFSVDNMKRKWNDRQLCLKEKNPTEATNPRMTLQESLNPSELSTVNPDMCNTTGFMHSKTKNRYECSFTKTRDELESNKYARKLDKFRYNKDQSVSPAVSGDIPRTKKGCSFQTSKEADGKVSSHVKEKGLAKRKKENQEHVTVRKRNKSISESCSPSQTKDDSKKTRKRKPNSFSKNSSESQQAKKNKDAEGCLNNCKNKSKKSKSDKNSVLKDSSQGLVDLPQVSLIFL